MKMMTLTEMRMFFQQRNWIAARHVLAAMAMICSTAEISVSADFTSRDYQVGQLPAAILAYDFNHDGKPDLAVLNNGDGTVSILLNKGDGTFQNAKAYQTGGQYPTSFTVADFDGDGNLDFAVAFSSTVPYSCSGSSVSIILGNGDGTFKAAVPALVDIPSYTAYVAAGDVTGDGKADLLVLRYQNDPSCTPPGGYSIFPGKGDGTFQAEQPVPSNPPDFNGDGIPDIAAYGGGGLNIFLGQGNAQFRPLSPGPESNNGLLLIGDFNADKIQDQAFIDVACINKACFFKMTFVAVGLGDGLGKFRTQDVSPGYVSGEEGFSIHWIATGDFNGDGKSDLAYINAGTPGFRVILGRGDGTFPSLVDFNSGSGPGSFMTADLNGDGLSDVVLGNVNDGTISVSLSTLSTSGADLSVAVSANPSPVSVTQNLTYRVTVQNRGPKDATNVVVTDTLPNGVNFISASMTQGTCTQANLVVTCNVNTLVSGDAAFLTILVVPNAAGTMNDSATATEGEEDPNPANNTATISTVIDPMFTITVTFVGTGSGSVSITSPGGGLLNCTSTCTQSLPVGYMPTLVATPNTNVGFGGWNGTCGNMGPGTICEGFISMSSNVAVTAEFDPLPNFSLYAPPTVTVSQGNTDTEPIYVYP